MKSPTEVRQSWVAALRDPAAKQTQGSLRDPDGMCCLGVLCNTIDPEGWRTNAMGDYIFGDMPMYPPPAVREAAGLTATSMSRLSNLNDSQNRSFGEIADLIERHWDWLCREDS